VYGPAARAAIARANSGRTPFLREHRSGSRSPRRRSHGAGLGGRRLLRFSLRTLFLLMTLIAVWLGLLTKRAREQQLAVDRIAELGGFVGYDFEYGRDGARIKDATPAGWTWLRKIVGDHYFQRVVRVHLYERAVTDADLKLIGKLRHTTSLDLNDTDISDDGMASVVGSRPSSVLGPGAHPRLGCRTAARRRIPRPGNVDPGRHGSGRRRRESLDSAPAARNPGSERHAGDVGRHLVFVWSEQPSGVNADRYGGGR
jgi:hypothetical protein